MMAGYANVLITWALRDVYMSEYRRAHRPSSLVDWTVVLPLRLGLFLSTSDNYGPSYVLRSGEADVALDKLEAGLAKNGMWLTYDERVEIKTDMLQMQRRASMGQ